MIGLVYRAFRVNFSIFKQTSPLLLLAILLSAQTQAQDYFRKIDWQKPKTYSVLGGKAVTQPFFTNARPDEKASMLPYYVELLPVTATGNITIQVLNPVYATADKVENASLPFIKNDITATAEFSYLRKQPKAFVSLLPFRRNPATGVIERLESFTLRIKIAAQPQKRGLNSYAANSVLSKGSWYKLSVNADGIYKIDYNFIKTTMGVDPSSFNLNTLGVFGNGGGMVPEICSSDKPDDLLENPTLVVDNNGNNKFDQDDYLLFYGQMPDEWIYNATTPGYPFSHQKNLQSDNNYYFLTTDAGTGKRVPTVTGPANANKVFNDFDEHAFHDKDEYNLLRSGRIWIGDKMTSYANTQAFSFNFPNIISSTRVKIKSSVAIANPTSSSLVLSINGQNIITHSDGGIAQSSYPAAANAQTKIDSFFPSGAQLNLAYTYNAFNDVTGTAAGYIDWVELFLKRQLTLSGDAMTFRSASSVGPGNVSQFNLGNANANTAVWDVTDVGNIQQMQGTLNGSQLTFTSSTNQLKEFIALNVNGSFGSPAFVSKIDNQNLHATPASSLVIVTYDDFVSSANDLADFHRSYDKMTASVVKLSQVYNEFGSGKPDISAIRDFVKMLYDRAGNDSIKKPRYLLLMGDGSYDPKGRIASSGNFVPCYESYESYDQIGSYVSDDFFGLLDDGEGGNIGSNQQMDISVGRLPVATETEAADVVTKIKNYKKIAQGCSTCVQVANNNSWRNKVTFIADYLYNGGTIFEDGSDQLAEGTRHSYPVYNYEKIYVDAYKLVTTSAGDRFPDANAAILNTINSGTLIINWVGHGGETNWSNARIFNMADIVQLQNQNLPLFITATCDFSRYDLPDRTAGESLITNAKGGGIASVTTVRLVYEDANAVLNQAVCNYMFAPYEGRMPTLGEITLLTKNYALLHTDPVNSRKFTLLGDPALQLDYPRYNVATTMVNNKSVTVAHDTLKALTQVTIKGEIRDDNNNKLTSFNGTIYPQVYDKITPFQTLGSVSPFTTKTYTQYKNILFRGKASVTNGDFSFTFIVPKDINYQYGNGRISYYADNGVNLDAHGYSTDIVIGGSSDTAHMRTQGPKMSLYMNDIKFVYGGTTNESPILLVELQDPGGINTTGNGLGHDLTAILDENNQNRTVLNNYYETALNDFTKGEVKYPYTKLTDGHHTLRVKAWNIYDNSTEGYTEFVVTSNAKLALNHVYNYPNPFTTHTQFMFEHNSPCEDLNVSVQIYSVSGRLVKSITQLVHSVGYRVDDIAWDGLDDYGDAIGKGVYVYKINVRDANGNSAHKFEKLVVLR